jgi:glycolate oxidase FAD binding subunit
VPVDTPAFLDNALRSVGLAAPPANGEYSVDGVAPSWFAAPETQATLASMLATCGRKRVAVIPWGGGKHMTLGNIPAQYDVAISMLNLSRVVEYEPADMTVTVESGMKMSDLQELLAKNGQFLPIDSPPHATVGGVLAVGASGPSRHRYGLPRDWLIGCKLVLADGTIVKGGGRVVKNVAGYDLPRLAVGSLGTAGLITEATFKVTPIPAARATALIKFPSSQEASAAVLATGARHLSLRSAVLLASDEGGATAAFQLAGPARAVERSRQQVHELAGARGCEFIDGDPGAEWPKEPGTNKRKTVLRASLPPSKVGPFLQLLERESERVPAGQWSIEGYPTTGLIHYTIADAETETCLQTIESARHEARAMQGSVDITAAPVDVKHRIDVWDDVGPSIHIMRRLKEEFDPNRTLSPGRYVGRI